MLHFLYMFICKLSNPLWNQSFTTESYLIQNQLSLTFIYVEKKVVKSIMWLPLVEEIEKQMVHKILVSPWLGMLCINTILCDKISTYIDIMWFQLVVILYIDGTITFFISLHGALRKLYTCELPIHMHLNINSHIYIPCKLIVF